MLVQDRFPVVKLVGFPSYRVCMQRMASLAFKRGRNDEPTYRRPNAWLFGMTSYAEGITHSQDIRFVYRIVCYRDVSIMSSSIDRQPVRNDDDMKNDHIFLFKKSTVVVVFVLSGRVGNHCMSGRIVKSIK